MNKIMERCLIQTQIAYIYILRISLWHRCDACGKRSRGLTDMLCGLLSLGRRLLWSWLSLPANVGRKCFITYSVCLSLWLLLIFLCLQSRYGTRRLSTRSPPTSTSQPCRLSWPLTSPSTSRAALLQECFWKTWASRTSSGWSSPVSQHSHCNRTPQRARNTRQGHGRRMRAYTEASRRAVEVFLLFSLLSGNTSWSVVDSFIS